MKLARLAAVGSIIALGLALGGCTSADAPEPVPRYDAETFFETTAITGASFSSRRTENSGLDGRHRGLQCL